MAEARCAMVMTRQAVRFTLTFISMTLVLWAVGLGMFSTFFGVVAGATSAESAQQSDTDAKADVVKAEADKAYAAQDWKRAAQLYGEMTKADAASGFAWYRLGNSLRHDGKYPEALAALEKAKGLGFQPLITQAMMAGAYSGSG